ncbi:hypothetical protein EJ06DRAFT_584763 [Trichodelitschia bisporula]|uniref:Uncharacterized protein n=1 Tax=Trichodelitschia bisporula TaxID=703511 RepID=A0A6G1HLW0_9PEZI|nr:hypothetical protein EJ06DRAFT_584763 [Trichodelitschia bisporula]
MPFAVICTTVHALRQPLATLGQLDLAHFSSDAIHKNFTQIFPRKISRTCDTKNDVDPPLSSAFLISDQEWLEYKCKGAK